MGTVSSSTSTQPLSLTGLANGLNTTQIIQALMSAERAPVTRMTSQEEKITAAQGQLQTIQTTLNQLATAASEFSLPSLYESGQTVGSSEPARVAVTATGGAGVGGYQVEVQQLANSAQRTFQFTSPEAPETVNIEGREYELATGATAKDLANLINSDTKGTVYAAALENGNIVLSSRATGKTGAEFVEVTPTPALKEVAETAREGRNAEYIVDGKEGESPSNTVTTAIPGVTMTLLGVTTTSGAVTVDVQPPGTKTAALEAQVKAFISTYNATVESLQKQLTTKPPTNPQNAKEYAVGTLFGDSEISGLLSGMREAMYEPIAGLAAGMSSPADVGINTGGASAGTPSQTSIEGMLTLDPEKLASAVAENPTGVQEMLEKWSQGLQKTVEAVAEPGGSIASRIEGDSTEVTELKGRIATMDEMLQVRENALVQTYAQLEAVLSNSNAQTSWLASQSEGLTRSGL